MSEHEHEREQAPMEILRELVQTRYQQEDWRAWRERSADLTSALRVLSRDQAHLLVREWWTGYDHEAILPFLGQLNTSVPGALAEWSGTFLALGHLLPSWLYLSAAPTTTRHLVDLFDQPAFVPQREGLLRALAWVGDDLVRDQFRAWRTTPPLWRSPQDLAPAEYAMHAGWELLRDGERRDLYHQTSYELVPVDEPELTPSTHAVAVCTPNEVACGWCGRTLVTLLEIDLRDPRCAFLALEPESAASPTGGTRLRLAHCLWCSAYGTLYTDVDLHGGVAWSAANEEMPHILQIVGLGTGEDLPPPAPRRLALGAKRRTPFEVVGRSDLDETGISQIGGHPEWIQDTAYPVCPGCRRRMVCIGQVSWEDIDEFAEGSTYAFMCLPCGKGATTYQQT